MTNAGRPKLARRRYGLMLTFALGGCSEATPIPPASPTPNDPSPQGEAESEVPTIEAPPGEPVSFDAELAKVSQLRGLRPQGSISGLRVSNENLVEHVRQSMKLERPVEALEGTEAMLVGLGAVPLDFDFETTLLKLLSGNLAGLYEPRLKMMLVRDDLGPDEAAVTLLHELVHALQDQHFDLREVVEFHPDDSDLSSAISCLAEGDATSAMLDGVLPNGQTALMVPEELIEKMFFSELGRLDAPPIIVRSLYAPYLDGLRFVHQLRRRGGFAEVDRAWENAPQSTEQILHLDKFDAHEAPLSVAIPPAPGPKWSSLFHDVWGEQSLRIWLEEWVDPKVAFEAAGGWGGDRIAAYQLDDWINIAWDIEMDSAADATELFEVLMAGLETEEEAPREPTASRTAVCGSPKNSAVHLLVQKQDKLLRIRSAPLSRSTGQSKGCSSLTGRN